MASTPSHVPPKAVRYSSCWMINNVEQLLTATIDTVISQIKILEGCLTVCWNPPCPQTSLQQFKHCEDILLENRGALSQNVTLLHSQVFDLYSCTRSLISWRAIHIIYHSVKTCTSCFRHCSIDGIVSLSLVFPATAASQSFESRYRPHAKSKGQSGSSSKTSSRLWSPDRLFFTCVTACRTPSWVQRRSIRPGL